MSPGASAQLPPLPALPGADGNTTIDGNAAKQIALGLNVTYTRIAYLGQARIAFRLDDLSRDSLFQPGTPLAQPGSFEYDAISVTLEWQTPDGRPPAGWAAFAPASSAYLYGGDFIEGDLVVSNGGAIRDQIVKLRVNATYTNPRDGTTLTDDETLTLQVEPYYQGFIFVKEYPPKSEYGQFETIRVPVEVRNTGIYPDTFDFETIAPEGFQVHVDPRVYVEPLSSRVVNLTIVTPHGKLYEPGRPGTIFVNAHSINDPEITYTAVVPIQIRGAYVPVYWIPLFLLSLVSTASLVSRRLERAEMARLEKGRPRYPSPSAKQSVLLAELKRRDPEAYKARKAQLDAIYKARVAEYRERRKDEVTAERLEMRVARAELSRDRKARRERRKAEKREAAQRAKAERAERKEQRKRAKVLGKQKAKLAKKRAKLDAKQAKRDAKQAKKDAKAAAKQAKVDAARAKRAAKEAKKAEKASRKQSR